MKNAKHTFDFFLAYFNKVHEFVNTKKYVWMVVDSSDLFNRGVPNDVVKEFSGKNADTITSDYRGGVTYKFISLL